jgi:hypothetical protein
MSAITPAIACLEVAGLDDGDGVDYGAAAGELGQGLADGGDLPVAAVAIELDHHQCCGGPHAGDVIAVEHILDARGGDIDQAGEGVADLIEGLAIVAVDHEHDRLDLGVDTVELDCNPLVVAFALAGEVVTSRIDGVHVVVLVAEPDDVDLVAVGVIKDGGEVEIDFAGLWVGVPTTANENGSGGGFTGLGQGEPAAFGEGDRCGHM